MVLPATLEGTVQRMTLVGGRLLAMVDSAWRDAGLVVVKMRDVSTGVILGRRRDSISKAQS
jgi:hypothetical protein